MLDIAIIIPELEKYGGAERYCIECITRWQEKHNITLYSTKFNYQLLKEHGIGKRVILKKLTPNFEGPHSMLLNCVLLPKIWELEIGNHDIYHTHLWPTHLIDLHPQVWFPHEPLRLLHDLRYNQPVTQISKDTFRNIHIYPKYDYDKVVDILYESYLSTINNYDKLGQPESIVANSYYTAKYLEEVYGRKVEDVVYPGVNIDDFIPNFFENSDENILLTVGQLWPHKRIKLSIEAIKYVDEAQLYIVGSGPELDNLKKIALNLGVDDRVFFLAGLSNSELQILYSRSLAVLFTPIKEPFGIVALEAMAAGKPLIAVNEGGYTEIVDESCAFLVPPYPIEIAEKIKYLIQNKDIARKMGLAGHQKSKKYTWDKAASLLLSIIERTYSEWNKKHFKPYKKINKKTLFGIEYYCWYGDGYGASHWNDSSYFGTVTDTPVLGYYCSSQGFIIENHLKMINDIGVDFLILNLHVDSQGINSYELATIENIFAISQKINTPLKLAIKICPYDPKLKDIENIISIIKEKFVSHDNYLRYDKRPVLFLFWTGQLDGNKKIINLFKEKADKFLTIASSLRLYSRKDEHNKTFYLFDGFSLFSPLELCSRENWTKIWNQAYKNSNAGKMNLKICTISPGYDDSHLKDPQRIANPYRTINRENGKIYNLMIKFVLSLRERPDIVIISTFNEFHENTHIEPSLTHGDLYLKLTKKFIIDARKKWKAI